MLNKEKFNEIKEWFENIGDTSTCSNKTKIIFLLSNIIYFIPILIYGVNVLTITITMIGLISLLFHSCQCHNVKSKASIRTFYLDVFICPLLVLLIIIKYNKIIPSWWYLGLLISLVFFTSGTNDRGPIGYVILHSLWHIMTGLLLLFVAYSSKKIEKSN